jgi:hypothetical protein
VQEMEVGPPEPVPLEKSSSQAGEARVPRWEDVCPRHGNRKRVVEKVNQCSTTLVAHCG